MTDTDGQSVSTQLKNTAMDNLCPGLCYEKNFTVILAGEDRVCMYENSFTAPK